METHVGIAVRPISSIYSDPAKPLKPAWLHPHSSFVRGGGADAWKTGRESLLLSLLGINRRGESEAPPILEWARGDFDGRVASLLQSSLAILKGTDETSRCLTWVALQLFLEFSLNCNWIRKDSLKGTAHLVWDWREIGGDGGGSRENLHLFQLVV